MPPQTKRQGAQQRHSNGTAKKHVLFFFARLSEISFSTWGFLFKVPAKKHTLVLHGFLWFAIQRAEARKGVTCSPGMMPWASASRSARPIPSNAPRPPHSTSPTCPPCTCRRQLCRV
eukprot:2221496-Rhodomonas_salina.3